jgi:transposase-like protein
MEGHSEEQILRANAPGGERHQVSEICREYDISEATFYIWKKKYAGVVSVSCTNCELREEN